MSEQQDLTPIAPIRLHPEAIGRALAWLTRSHLRAVGALLSFSVLCFLPGQAAIPPVDRDEARYVQATTQMLETGDYVDIRLHDGPRHLQPAGIYWLQAAFVRLLGADVPAPIWVHRLPSLIGACLVVLLTYGIGLAFDDRRTALLAGLMMASTVLLNVEARLAKTDATLSASIVACQWVLLRLYVAGRSAPDRVGLALVFWLAAAVGILVKGPVLPLVVGLTMIGASLLARDARWLRGLRPGIGIPLLLVVALPWYVAIGVATDGAFFAKAISYNVVTKITTGHQSHGFPPGFYLAAVWVTLWPVAAVAAAALPALWRERRSRRMRFVAAWVLPAWVVFELVPTKLPHYVLPLYPAMAIAPAWALAAGRVDAERAWVRTLMALSTSGPLVIVVVFLAGAITLGSGLSTAAAILATVSLVLSFGALRLILAGELLSGWLVLAVGSVPLAYTFALGAVAPRLDALWLSPRLARATEEVSGCADPRVISVGNQEASLIFAVGTDIRFGDAHAAAAFLGGGPCRAAIVERKAADRFAAELAAKGTTPAAVRRVSGLNIGNTRFVEFAVHGGPRDEAAVR